MFSRVGSKLHGCEADMQDWGRAQAAYPLCECHGLQAAAREVVVQTWRVACHHVPHLHSWLLVHGCGLLSSPLLAVHRCSKVLSLLHAGAGFSTATPPLVCDVSRPALLCQLCCRQLISLMRVIQGVVPQQALRQLQCVMSPLW